MLNGKPVVRPADLRDEMDVVQRVLDGTAIAATRYLLSGAPPCGLDPLRDAYTYLAGRPMPHMRPAARAAWARVAHEPRIETAHLEALERALRRELPRSSGDDEASIRETLDRMSMLLAWSVEDLERQMWAARTARRAAFSYAVDSAWRWRGRCAALAWLEEWTPPATMADRIQQICDQLGRLGASRERALEQVSLDVMGQASAAEVAARLMSDRDQEPEDRLDDGYAHPPAERLEEHGVVVLRQLSRTGNDREGARQFADMVGSEVPLVPRPDVVAVRNKLVEQAPHLEVVIETMLQATALSRAFRIRPTLLVGEPGCGKSWLAARLPGACDSPVVVYPAGGAADGTLGGTSRQWHSARPSVPLQLVRQHMLANPTVVIDEIDKAGTERRNGNVHDALLALLEPGTARQFLDPFLEVPADLSRVNWILTANSLEGLPAPLLDRVRVLHVSDPQDRHAPGLIRSLLAAVAREREIPAVWVPPLGAEDVDIISRAWRGGPRRSMRVLRRCVETWLDCQHARELAH